MEGNMSYSKTGKLSYEEIINIMNDDSPQENSVSDAFAESVSRLLSESRAQKPISSIDNKTPSMATEN